MAKKAVTHKRNAGGLEAPRNSLEMPIETSYGIYSGRDNILYAYHVNKGSSENCCSTETPRKKLFGKEIKSTVPNTRQSTPSVVARLMGVDTLPFDSKPSPQLLEMKDQNHVNISGRSKIASAAQDSSTLYSSGLDTYRYSDQCTSHKKSNKPKAREHPQEEELQKFKKEFEAWQAARFKECSKAIEFDCAPSQLIAQEDLLREKMFLYVNSKDTLTSRNREKKNEHISDEAKVSFSSNRSSITSCRASQVTKYDREHNNISSPTKIVILRPGPDRMVINEDSWNSTPSSSEERGSIKDFLEEVKERLKSEMHGKSYSRAEVARGGGIETPYSEKPSEPRQIAHRIAQQVRDSVTREFGMNLLRSESTRSYQSDSHVDEIGSPEFINKDTRKFLTEKLRNVLKGETQRGISGVSHNSPGLLNLDCKNGRAESNGFELEKQRRSLEQESDELEMSQQELSPSNLIRSLSAPVSGTSFGKLLLEDRHILTGAQIRRQHEVVKKVSVNNKKPKKDRFNIKEKVSSFRYSLTLKGSFFHRRIQSMEGSNEKRHDPWRDISSGPTVVGNFYANENYTEVPPSPASVCSSVHEDFWRSADYSSPTSSLGIHQMDECEIPHDLREINSNLNELRRKLNQFEGSVPAETITEQDIELNIEDQAEAYVRDLLVASGLYHSTCNVPLAKWDPLGKPISNQVFEEVEESYKQIVKHDGTSHQDEQENFNHKLLLDLLNEALPAILNPRENMSRYMKAISSVHNKPLSGRNLLFHVWEIVKSLLRPSADGFFYSFDSMLARDLEGDYWSGLMDDDINAIGRDLEGQIIGDLLEEMVNDMQLCAENLNL